MSIYDIAPAMLLAVLGIALAVAIGVVVVILWRPWRKANTALSTDGEPSGEAACRSCLVGRPVEWLAIKSRNPKAVQRALGLHHAKPCTWVEAMGEKLFIAPPVKGWILVLGTGLPDPGVDIDVCYRFVVDLSRKLGQVQLFNANEAVRHHAWVCARRGRIVRAYAWAGRTLWKQGKETRAERELGLRCFDYAESLGEKVFGEPDVSETNMEKIPLLAGRWSLDPSRLGGIDLEHERGIAGELQRKY